MENFRYITENTVDHLSLHDCICAEMYREGDSLVFEMEWLEVLASHPDNPFPQAHQSGAGRIVLRNAVITRGILICGNETVPLGESTIVKDFEILSFDEERTETGFVLSLFGDSVQNPKADFIEITARYTSSQVMFGELGGVSWFESM